MKALLVWYSVHNWARNNWWDRRLSGLAVHQYRHAGAGRRRRTQACRLADHLYETTKKNATTKPGYAAFHSWLSLCHPFCTQIDAKRLERAKNQQGEWKREWDKKKDEAASEWVCNSLLSGLTQLSVRTCPSVEVVLWLLMLEHVSSTKSKVMITQWDNDWISLSVLSVAWVQFRAVAEYCEWFFPHRNTHPPSRPPTRLRWGCLWGKPCNYGLIAPLSIHVIDSHPPPAPLDRHRNSAGCRPLSPDSLCP